VKQFARCTHCRQWYAHHVVTAVEVIRGNGLQGTTLWCFRCIRDTEERSQMLDEQTGRPAPSAVALHAHGPLGQTAPLSEFNAFIQEHLDLMERALYEDDAIIVPRVEAFMQRCRSYQGRIEAPDQVERLTRHLYYWEAFLKAMRQSP
jgi:hypothetical protein